MANGGLAIDADSGAGLKIFFNFLSLTVPTKDIMSTADQATIDLAFTNARSQNGWTDKPVTDAQLHAIYEIAKWGPTSMNCQPARIQFLRSKEAKDRLLPCMSPGNQNKTATAPVVAIIGYNPEFYLELVKTFAHNPNARLVMVGSGPLLDPMRELGKSLNVADKILWLGERDARDIFAAFDIFALSSRKEGLPYVLLEAMAVGLPLVATESSGVEILIESGINGTIVPTDDIAAFGAALTELAADPARVARYGKASLEKSLYFTTDAMVDRTLAVYRDAVPYG